MADRAGTALDRMMVITPERVFYAGLLGRPRRRMSGGLNIYVALDGSVSVATDAWTRREAAVVVPAYMPHCVASDHPAVICIVIEPETIADRTPPILDAYLAAIGPAHFAVKVRSAACALQESQNVMTSDSFDRKVFDIPLPGRAVDRRIRLAITALSDGGSSSLTAADCADRAKLSPSRFLHLFKDETGVSFRAFRAWKRARHMLHFVNEPLNLAHLAQDMGYPDSTHFSHSIRRFYGLKPRAIFSGSRDLAIFRSAATSP